MGAYRPSAISSLGGSGGGGGGLVSGGNLYYATFNRTGELFVVTGVARWYPPKAGIFKSVRAWVGVPSNGADINLIVKKSGVSISAPSILSGEYKTAVYPLSGSIALDDYLTVDITQVGSLVPGQDLIVMIGMQ